MRDKSRFRAQQKQTLLRALVITIVLLLYVLATAFFLSETGLYSFQSVTALTLVAVGIVLWISYVQGETFDVLDPANVIVAILIIGFVGSFAFGKEAVRFDRFHHKTLLIIGAALLTFVVGYRGQASKKLASIVGIPKFLNAEMSMNQSVLLFFLWTATVLFRVRFFVQQGYGTAVAHAESSIFSSLILVFGDSGPYLLYLILLILLSRTSRISPTYLILAGALIVEVAIEAIAGWKSSGMVLLIAALLLYRNRSGSRSWQRLLPLLASLLLFFTMFTIVDEYRSEVGRRGASTALLVESATSRTNSLDETLAVFSTRIDYGLGLSTLVQAVDVPGVIELQKGATLWPALIWFVPRAIWEDKPPIRLGGIYAQQVLGWGPGAEAAVTVPGDFYLNFGLPGVVVGMYVYGLFLRFLYEYLIKCVASVQGILVFIPIFLVFGLEGFERNVAAIFAEGFLQSIWLLALLWAIFQLRQMSHRILRRNSKHWQRSSTNRH